MSDADGALRRQAFPRIASTARVLLRPSDGFKDRFCCLRGPYLAHYADASMEKAVAFTVLRPTSRVARMDRLAQATDGVLPPQPAVLKIWETHHHHEHGTPAAASGTGVAPPPTGFRLEAPTYLSLDTVADLLHWLVAIDGVLRVMRGDFALPRPPSAVPSFVCVNSSHDSASFAWAPVPVSRPAERVQAFVLEFWRLRHGDVVALPDSASDLHSLEVHNPWLPADGAHADADAAAAAAASLGLVDDARIPGLSGGDAARCTVVGLRPRAKYAFRIRAANAAGRGLAGGDEGFAAALAASEKSAAAAAATATAAEASGGAGAGRRGGAAHSDGIAIATTLGPPSVGLPAPLLCQPHTHEVVAAWPLPVLPRGDAACTGFVLHVFEAAAADAVQVRAVMMRECGSGRNSVGVG